MLTAGHMVASLSPSRCSHFGGSPLAVTVPDVLEGLCFLNSLLVFHVQSVLSTQCREQVLTAVTTPAVERLGDGLTRRSVLRGHTSHRPAPLWSHQR